MKLLYFSIQINTIGGLAKIVIEKINWLVDHGYEVTLCNIERIDVNPAFPIDSRVKLVRGNISTTPGGFLTRLKGVIGAIKRTKEIIKQESPDIVINAHCPLVTWIIPWVKCNGKSPKTITEMHQSRQGLEVFNRDFMSGFSRWIHKWSTKYIYGRYDKFVVLTNGDGETWNINNYIVIPNYSSMNCSEIKPNLDANIQNGKSQILMIARLMPQKRIDLLIRVWSILAKDYPNWQVKVLGDGMLKQDLINQIKDYGIEDSFFLSGEVNDVSRELSASKIVCQTSEYEGLSLVLIESMRMHVPVIAFEYIGIHDVIEDGVNGFIVPFGNVNEYARKLKLLMDSDELRVSLSNVAFESTKKFDKEFVMKRWDDLFHSFFE